MTLSHTKRVQKRVRLSQFKLHMEDSERLDFLQRTKYHYSVWDETHSTLPIEAYPTTLKLVTGEGETVQCHSVEGMFTEMRRLFDKQSQ